ncbi:hypothetical protein CVT24_000108 [Panaeolus cyanescens]|uniref:Uncharacterized protein n=1 Tax=Panaeolus cyanescens TaxID=181874 RepID=A0A409W7M2_9AGAR|nr:hypothetical protein CVT24_000108 [Panaeolus cyanescens]
MKRCIIPFLWFQTILLLGLAFSELVSAEEFGELLPVLAGNEAEPQSKTIRGLLYLDKRQFTCGTSTRTSTITPSLPPPSTPPPPPPPRPSTATTPSISVPSTRPASSASTSPTTIPTPTPVPATTSSTLTTPGAGSVLPPAGVLSSGLKSGSLDVITLVTVCATFIGWTVFTIVF